MTRTRLGLLSLCVMVFGLMTCSATVAQAEIGAKFLILTAGGVLKTGSELPAEINTEAEGTWIMHSEIAKVKVLLECTGQSLTGNPKLGANGSISTFQIRFTGCITKLNGVTSAACKPNAGGTESGVVKSLPLHGLAALHELAGGGKDDIIKVLPVVGNIILHDETSEECSIGENLLLFGTLALKDCENLALTHLVKHLIEVLPALTRLYLVSDTPEHATTLLGSAWAFLVGPHLGLKWSWDPI